MTQSCACTGANGNLNGVGGDCPGGFDLFNATDVANLQGTPQAFIPAQFSDNPILNPPDYACLNADPLVRAARRAARR